MFGTGLAFAIFVINRENEEVVDRRRITDWTLLPGASIEIRQQSCDVWSGHVDAVTDDGKILWVVSSSGQGKLFEKVELHKAWAAEERYGFHCKVTKNLDNLEEYPDPYGS